MRKSRTACAVLLGILMGIQSLAAIPAALYGRQMVGAPVFAEEDSVRAEAEETGNGNEELLVPESGETAEVFAAERDVEKVYVGGMPLTLSLKNRGLVIIGKIDVITQYGMVSTVKNSDLRNGDTLLSAGGIDVNTAEELAEVINREELAGKVVPIVIRRKGEKIETVLEPALDIATNRYKAGLLVREDTYGVGTLTYTTESGRFGSLGHPVFDPDTESVMEISGGSAYRCKISDVVKGQRGTPGELKGGIDRTGGALGTLELNNKYGVYGTFSTRLKNPLFPDPVEVCPHQQVRPGKAQILTTLEGSTPSLYDIEIVKCANQRQPDDKSMVLKVTDSELLERAGGIVQGMSGSPILQNGKFVGAVTHVFINDPTRGYGVYADWMLLN